VVPTGECANERGRHVYSWTCIVLGRNKPIAAGAETAHDGLGIAARPPNVTCRVARRDGGQQAASNSSYRKNHSRGATAVAEPPDCPALWRSGEFCSTLHRGPSGAVGRFASETCCQASLANLRCPSRFAAPRRRAKSTLNASKVKSSRPPRSGPCAHAAHDRVQACHAARAYIAGAWRRPCPSGPPCWARCKDIVIYVMTYSF
jgi:hypothetical protein